MNEVYERIRRLCELNNLTDSELCRRVGLMPSYVSDIKTGRKKYPSAMNMNKIANYFGVSANYILNGEDEVSEEDLLIDQIKNNDDLRALFMTARNASSSDIQKAIKIIEALKSE